MSQAVVELRQNGRGWLLTLDGRILVSAIGRDAALGTGARIFRSQLSDPAALAAMQFRGLTASELMPARPIEPCRGPLPSKIDFAEARRLVAERWLPIAEKQVRTAVAIVDELCIEYEWGWAIHWRPVEPEDPGFVNRYPHPFLADRVTGETSVSGGTLGLQRGIIAFLQLRPPELCGPYPPGKQGWGGRARCVRGGRGVHPNPATHISE